MAKRVIELTKRSKKSGYVSKDQRKKFSGVAALRRATEQKTSSLYGDEHFGYLEASGVGSKTGVHSFSLPAILSCIGATLACAIACYAQKGRVGLGDSASMFWRNMLALRDTPPDRWAQLLYEMVVRVIPLKAGAFRIHVSGDFFSQEYLDAWSAVARRLPKVQFWAYTRSFELDFSDVPDNVALYASADQDNLDAAVSFAVTNRVPVAWMGPDVSGGADRYNTVCPHQTGKVANCASCGMCIHGRKNVIFLLH